mmetsp:Transcript_2177/g.4618  ORF Transcript_2177/g.4618 Transcript_2177/m.4618 type:complete len:209 (-) Transcript_2177:119-745(-)
MLVQSMFRRVGWAGGDADRRCPAGLGVVYGWRVIPGASSSKAASSIALALWCVLDVHREQALCCFFLARTFLKGVRLLFGYGALQVQRCAARATSRSMANRFAGARRVSSAAHAELRLRPAAPRPAQTSDVQVAACRTHASSSAGRSRAITERGTCSNRADAGPEFKANCARCVPRWSSARHSPRGVCHEFASRPAALPHQSCRITTG